jgi:quercetin dioxygenase-like cupin family protein
MTPPSAPLANISDAARIILENEYIRVTRVSLAPGEGLPSHSGERRTVYALSDYTTSWTGEGEDGAVKNWSTGDVHFHEAGDHSLMNTGPSEATFLVFERLAEGLPETETRAVMDAAAESPETSELLAENDVFRVLRIDLAPGEAQPMHDGRPRVIYSLSDYEIEWREAGEATTTRNWSQGDIHWHLSGEHAARNTGDTAASWLIVSLKK